jgi:tetratricopeptide (TPR) repeat protein
MTKMVPKRESSKVVEAKLRAAAGAGDVDAYHDLGLLLRSQGRLQAAEELYKTALDQGMDDLLLDYGNLLADQQDRSNEAEQLFRRALDAGDTQAHNNLAQLLTEMGRLDDAELEYRRGIRMGDLTAQRNLDSFSTKRAGSMRLSAS